jgi:hypothetical protein
MKVSKPLVATLLGSVAFSLLHGCASAPSAVNAAEHKGSGSAVSDAVQTFRIANRTEVPVEKNAPQVEGRPLTSVVVTQCNLMVAVYMTMQDGRLLRFDNSAGVQADKLLEMAYTANRSERVEVSCEDRGIDGYEKHSAL